MTSTKKRIIVISKWKQNKNRINNKLVSIYNKIVIKINSQEVIIIISIKDKKYDLLFCNLLKNKYEN